MARPKKGEEKPLSERPDWARRITEVREKAGLSQGALGKEVGQSQRTISDWERGRTEPNLTAIRILAEKLGVSQPWLLFGVGPREPQQGDSAAIATAERHKNSRNFSSALVRLARMLAEEGLEADASFLVRKAARIAKEADDATDQLEAHERVDRAVEMERLKWREGLDALKNSS